MQTFLKQNTIGFKMWMPFSSIAKYKIHTSSIESVLLRAARTAESQSKVGFSVAFNLFQSSPTASENVKLDSMTPLSVIVLPFLV